MRSTPACALVAALVLLVVLGPAAWSVKQPRATCLDCHLAEGMKYAVIQTTPFIEVPMGDVQTLEVTIGNPWLHDITSALITVDLTNAPTIGFETAEPLNLTEPVELSNQANSSVVPFQVLAGATGVVARMTQPPDASPFGAVDVDTALRFPSGPAARAPPDGLPAQQPTVPPAVPSPTSARTTEAYSFAAADVATRPTGTWNLSLYLQRPSALPSVPVDVEVHVFYNTTKTQSQLMTQLLDPGDSGTTRFVIKGLDEGEAKVAFAVEITSNYVHPKGIGAQDDGNATLRRGLNFTVGQTLELGAAAPPVPPLPPISWKLNARIWGEATGFIGLFMVPLSLVLGGAFGRRNVIWINQVTHSARLRVLWHNALSFFLLAFALVHLALFLYEEVYSWSVGFIWGGIGTLALIGLGITGGYQRRIAKAIGYANWRILHISMAVLFVATVLVHVLVDGAHFDVFRRWLRLDPV